MIVMADARLEIFKLRIQLEVLYRERCQVRPVCAFPGCLALGRSFPSGVCAFPGRLAHVVCARVSPGFGAGVCFFQSK
jgi:hypothetical protein